MTRETVLLHFSDPHFGTERPAVAEALVRLVHAQAPALLVLSGDITQRARAAQFAAARAFVDRLGPLPLLAIPGNHDLPLFDLARRVRAPYARYRHAFGDAREFESEALLVLALDTTRPWRHKNGVVSPAQVEAAARRLAAAAARERLRIVVVHQPVAVTRAEDEKNLLRGHRAALRRWCAAGADLILAGHIHLPFVVALHERDAALPRRCWAVNAGTALSSRVRHEAANSVNLIRYRAPRRCSVERWDYGPTRDAFELAERHQLALDGALADDGR